MAYDRPRTGIMLAYPFEERRLAKWSLPYLVQPKYDGERCLVCRTSSGVLLLSSTGLPITGMPHIEAAAQDLPLGIYDGELYVHGQRQRLASLMRRNTTADDHKEAILILFDLKSAYKQEVRLYALTQLGLRPYKGIIRIAPSWAVATQEDIEALLAEQMAQGYEGVILRERNALYAEKRVSTMLKIKPRQRDQYRIVGYEEGKGWAEGKLGSFILQDVEGNTFNVGSGFTAAQRVDYWHDRELLVGHEAAIVYQNLTDRGVPYAPIFKAVVI